MKVLLNCFPPSVPYMPDMGISVLKSYLTQENIHTDILYWNILLSSVTKEIIPPNTDYGNILTAVLPYLIDYNNGDVTDKMKIYLQAKNPTWRMMGENYYEEYLTSRSKKIHEIIQNTIEEKKIYEYDLIGISYKFYQWIPALIFIRELRLVNPNAKIVIGALPSRIEAIKILETFHTDIDYAIWGEGEIALYQLVSFLSNKNNDDIDDIEQIQSLIYHKQGKVISHTCPVKFTELISPDYSDYVDQAIKEKVSHVILNVETSRGCYWNKCKFCYLNEGYKYRRKTINEIIRCIDEISLKYGIQRITFNDNDFCGTNMEKTEKMLDAIIEYNKDKGIEFLTGEFNSKKLNKTIIKKVKLAGFRSIQIGIESISDKRLRKIDKHASFINHLLAFKFCSVYGLIVTGSNLIKGFPDEEIQEFVESIFNMHYMRFVFNRAGIRLLINPLAIKETSKYMKEIPHDELFTWYSEYEYIIEDKKILVNKYCLFDYVSMNVNPNWHYLAYVINYYFNNKFNYVIKKQEEKNINSLLYREYFNEKLVSELVFDEMDWAIIEFCSNEIVSIQSLIEHILKNYPNTSSLEIMNTLSSLHDEQLIYIDQSAKEVFCIIDTELLHSPHYPEHPEILQP